MKTYEGEPMYVHPFFKELCYKIQEERIISKTDRIKNKMSLVKISKMIVNMIKSNDKIFKALIEVEQNGKN